MTSNLDITVRNDLLKTIGQREIDSLRKKLTYRYGQETANDAVSDALVALVDCYDPDRGASPFTLLTIYANNAAVSITRGMDDVAPRSFDEPMGETDVTLQDIIPDESAEITLDKFEQVPFSIATLEMVDRTLQNLNTGASMESSPAKRYNIEMAKKVLKVLVELIESDVLDDMGYGHREELVSMVAERLHANPKVVYNGLTELRRYAVAVAS